MDSTRWDRLERVFLDALERAPTDVAPFLDEATRGDADLRAEVEAMLAAHAKDDGLEIESMLSDVSGAPPLARVGVFRLVERVGHGGMGEVFRGERDDGQFQQTVAIKLVRAGLVTPEMTRRFRAERQILARLEHPNIARLLDGGITEQGHPYLVMEYVPGRTITEHTRGEALGLEARLALFVTVCRAVQYAHQNLVVHRDLKPSNILVGPRGDVKLLDFGVAKMLAADDSAPEATAKTGFEMMTPEYASPEQVRGESITTATDVYALGLLLYELLTGQRAQERGSSLLEMERVVCETDAAPPSDVAPYALRKRLRGDLDVIVATSLRKEPARRYATSELLAADVERYLRGMPIVARSDTFAYRAGKFWQRHRVAVGAAVAVVVSLVAGLVLAVAGMMRAHRAEELAVVEAATSARIADFLVDMFRHSDPGTAVGDAVTARQLLDEGARGIDGLADQPVVQARLLATMADAYNGLGLFDASLELSRRELAVQRAQFGDRSPEAGRALTRVSGVHAKQGDYPRARDVALEALAILEASLPEDHPDVAGARNQLAIAHGHLGENSEAASLLERALAIRERTEGAESIQLTGMLNNLAIIHWQMGDLDESRVLYERVLRIQEREYAPEHVSIAHTLNNLALVRNAVKDYAGARDLHERALAIREGALEPDHPDVGESLNNLGTTLLALEDYERAQGVFERALGIREKALGPEHSYVATTLYNVGTAVLSRGGGETSRPFFERALDTFERALGPDHAMVAYPVLSLAELDERAGDMAAAERGLRRAIAIRVARLGETHPDYAKACGLLADFLVDRGRPEEAAPWRGVGGSD